MNNITSKDNNLFDNSTTSESYQNQYSKQCSGRDCTKIAGNLLTILYINKKGYFCDDCAHELITKKLETKLQEMNTTEPNIK